MRCNRKSRPERFALCLLAVVLLSAMAQPLAAKTYRDYPEWELLPKGIDFDDPDSLARFQQLADEGEAGHEAMLAIVKECEDSRVARIALGTLRDMGGDMGYALPS